MGSWRSRRCGSSQAFASSVFLRARRGLLTPEQAGIPDHGVRRVPGLRREEVAMLAGISADHHLRLERGRDRNPSTQVLESIAHVLQLDDAHFAHLSSLVVETPRKRTRRPRKETVPFGVLKLLNTLDLPSFIEGRYPDVLAANSLAGTLDPRLVMGGNQLRDMFLDPTEQDLYPEWANATEYFAVPGQSPVPRPLGTPQGAADYRRREDPATRRVSPGSRIRGCGETAPVGLGRAR